MTFNKEFYIEGVLKGNRRILAKTLTLIESTRNDDRNLASEVIDTLFPYSGKSIRLGITGVPGVGKSTFIEALGLYLIQKGHHVAVLAVDPSSNLSHGSILGDKTRMEELAKSGNSFIRPSPTCGKLGGVAGKTRESIIACEAAGYDIILVETVGVGQSEITVSSMVDFFLVLMLAGAGDEVQGIKKGIIEYADAFIINKADGKNIKKAEYAKNILESALHYMLTSDHQWHPPVLTASSLEKKGIDPFWQTVLRFYDKMNESNGITMKRQEQAVAWIQEIIDDKIRSSFFERKEVQSQLKKIMDRVKQGDCTPSVGALDFFSAINS